MRRGLWGIGVLFGVVLAFVAVAAAGSGQGRVAMISGPGRYADMPAVAVDGRGDQTAAWSDLSQRSGGPEWQVMTSTRLVGGGGWSAPESLSGWAQSDGDGGPALAVDRSGASVIAWVETIPAGSNVHRETVVKARLRRSASARWGRTEAVGSTTTGGVVGLSVGIDSAGKVTAIWSPYGRTNPPIDYATANVGAARWQRARVLVQQGGIYAQLAVNGRGDALVSWQHELGSSGFTNGHPVGYLQMASYRLASGAWRPAVRLARFSWPPPGGGANEWSPTPQTIALDPHGGASVTWLSEEGNTSTLHVAHRSASSRRWTRSSFSSGNPGEPTIGADANGALTLVWAGQNGRPIVTNSRDGFHWSHPAYIAGVTGAPLLDWLSVGQRGNAILTWNAPPHGVFVSTRPSLTARWTKPVQIGRGFFPQAALDAKGEATITWLKSLAPKYVWLIYATTYPTR